MKVIEIAKAEVGYIENPSNSNKTKYGVWFGLDGVPWCGIFVSWCFAMAGTPLGRIGFKNGFAGCQTAVAHYRRLGKIVNEPEAGDIVFFDWNGDKRYDHTGIFVGRLSNTTFKTIEGNTSLINQSNGGQVMERVRTYRNALFVRPF